MELSIERQKYVASLACGAWVDDVRNELSKEEFYTMIDEKEEELFNLVENSKNPFELHIVASLHNWDDGEDLMIKVAHHPHCEAGTALLIYWLACPGYYTRYASRDEVDECDVEMYDFIHYIQDKYVSGGYPRKYINYDPADENDAEPPDEAEGEGKQEIPAIMYEPILVSTYDFEPRMV